MLTIPVEVLLPPTGLAVLALLAVLSLRGRRGGARRGFASTVLVLLILLGLPAVADSLMASLDPREAPDAAAPPPSAIVILSADLVRTGEAGRYDIGPLTLERERTGAALARRTGLPVLVTGGLVDSVLPIAAAMRDSMQADFGVTVRWTEEASTTTWENARFSATPLRADGIGRVYLVTHAWHMRRSLLAFRRAGIEAVAAPVRADPWPQWRLLDFIPRASAWQRSYWAMHEWAGLAWYMLRS